MFSTACLKTEVPNALIQQAPARVAAFNNGPHENIFVSGDFDYKFACVVTQFGELHCTAGIFTNVEPTPTMLTANREAVSYSIVRPTPVSMCGFTAGNNLECIDRTNYQERNRELLLATVNGELDLPTVEMLNAQVYDFGVELFFEKTITSSHSVNFLSHTEIFRNDAYLATTENGLSYYR